MTKSTDKTKKNEYNFKEKGLNVANKLMDHVVRIMYRAYKKGEPESSICKKLGVRPGTMQRNFDKLDKDEKIKFTDPRMKTYFTACYAYDISFTECLFIINPKRYKILKYFTKLTMEDQEKMAYMTEEQIEQMIKVIRSLLPEVPPKKEDKKTTLAFKK